MREEPVGELGNVARHERGLTRWRGGRGRSRLVSSETWHITNENSLPGGEEEGGGVSELGSVACHKRGLTSWRGGRGRSGLMSLEMWHVTNEDSLPGGEEKGEAGWLAWKRGTSETRAHFLTIIPVSTS